VPVLPPVVVRGPEEVIWGRYQAIAGGSVDAEMQAKLKTGAYDLELVLGPYNIARLKSTAYVAPREGTASFVLTGSDAVLQRAGGNWVQATVENAQLDVDFAKRTFKTSLDVIGDNMRVPYSVAGNIDKNGMLVNPNVITDNRIKGYLGGANVEEAAYLFQYKSNFVTVNGATKWSR